MGDFFKNEFMMYSGIIYVVIFFVVVVVLLLWGKFVDWCGCKIMLLCFLFGMVFVIGVMGFVYNIWIFILFWFL